MGMIQAQVVGQSGVSVRSLAGTVVTGQTATGATQATAFPVASGTLAFSTTAASTGAVLPPGTPGDIFHIYNGGANSLTVYPPSGGTINNLAADTGLALATLKSGEYVCVGALTYFSVLSA